MLLACALLAACSSTAPAPPPAQVEAPAPAAPPEPPPPPERAFPEDSLYALLVAEFALRRREFDVAVNTYMQQAPALRDPGVSAHTTHLTQYLRRDAETLAAAELWVSLEPDNLEARNTLASLLVRRRRSAEALPHLVAIERAGHEANFPVVVNDFHRLSDAERAELVAAVNALALEFPDNPSVLLTQAILQHDTGEQNAALATLARLFELDPQQEQALLLEAQIRAAQGAKNPYARIERVLADDPDNQVLRLRYARLLTRTDMRAARAQFEILSARSPEDGDLLYTLALINRETGDPLAAAAYLRQLIELEQRVDEAHYHLGRIEEERDNPQAAIVHYQAVGTGEQYMAANSRIGELLIEGGQPEQARAWFDEQRRLYPQRRQALFGLESELLNRAGYESEAMTLLDSALQEAPGANTLLYARAMLYEQRGDLAFMERDLRAILEDDPDNATALNALGYTLANRTPRLDEALQLISRALELQPGEPAILDSMGWVLYRLGRNDEAMDYLARAYAEFPDPEVAAHLGEVMWVSGDRPGALAIWRAAHALDPQHKVLRETLQRLGVDSLEADAAAGEEP